MLINAFWERWKELPLDIKSEELQEVYPALLYTDIDDFEILQHPKGLINSHKILRSDNDFFFCIGSQSYKFIKLLRNYANMVYSAP